MLEDIAVIERHYGPQNSVHDKVREAWAVIKTALAELGTTPNNAMDAIAERYINENDLSENDADVVESFIKYVRQQHQ